MKIKRKGLPYLLLCCLALSSSVLAALPTENNTPKQKPVHTYKYGYYKGEGRYKGDVFVKSRNHFEVIGAPGIAKLNAGNSSQLGVTSSETDKLVQTNTNSWDTFAGQLGVGYVYYFRDALQYSNKVQWFPSIEPELNGYYLASNSIKGNVLRFNSSNFNQLTYDIPIHSTRLMLDAALTVVSWKRLSLYALGGIGNAWNRISYSDTENSSSDNDCPDQRVSLSSNTSSNFAWEAGLGLIYAFNDRFGLSLEYLYTDLGTARTSASGNSGTITAPMLTSVHFNLRAQSALLGLHIAL